MATTGSVSLGDGHAAPGEKAWAFVPAPAAVAAILRLALDVASAAGPAPQLLSHTPGAKYEVTGYAFVYLGQKVPDTETKVEKTGWFETPGVAASDAGAKLTDGSLKWGDSVRTHFWNQQKKRIEALFDLGRTCRLDRIEVWASGGRQHGNFIKNCEIDYGLKLIQGRPWGGSIRIANPHHSDRDDPDEYALEAKGIGKEARFVKVTCRSVSAMMVLGEVKIWGTPVAAPDTPEIPAGTVRFEVESIEGTLPTGHDGMLGTAIWVGRANASFSLPDDRPRYVWIRYVDNGVRPLEVTVNGAAYRMPAQPAGQLWRWHRAGREPVAGEVQLGLHGPGEYPSAADSMVLTPSADLDPNAVSRERLMEVRQVRPPEGFAKRLAREQGDALSMAEWAEKVREHYGYPPPPTAPARLIDEYGNLLLQGRPFFSLAMFHASPADERLSRVAVNTYVSGVSKANVERNAAAVTGYHARWRAYDKICEGLKQHRDHPLLLMHYICDEPENVGVSVAELRRLNALVKALDPMKATFINVSPGMAGNRAVLGVPDVIGLDQYPIPGGRIADIGYSIDLARFSSGGKPLVFIAQSFNWGAYGRGDARWPTPDEVRAQAWLALVHNARGLWFYEFPAPTMSSKTCIGDIQPELWTDMQELFREIQSIAPGLTGPEVRPPFTAEVAQAKARPAELRLAVNAARTQGWLLAVNPWDLATEMVLDFAAGPLADIALTPAAGTRHLQLAGAGKGKFRLVCGPLASGVFAVKSTGLKRLVAPTPKQILARLQQRLEGVADRPQARAPLVETEPRSADSPEWRQAVDLLDTWRTATRPESARLLATRRGLHVHVVTRFPRGARSRHLERDRAVWSDPSIELFLGETTAQRYAQLVVNTANVQFDLAADLAAEESRDLSVDFAWESRVAAGEERADYFVIIPWREVRRMTQAGPGDTILFNLASTASRWDWAGLTGAGFHQPGRFGRLELPSLGAKGADQGP